jgi:excisionase family DNA binding protein
MNDVTLPMTEMSLPQLMSPDDAAGYLGVSAYTVRERLKNGEIPGRKHGARWLIRVVDLVQYVEPNNLR